MAKSVSPKMFSAHRHRTIAELADSFLEVKPRKEVQKLLKKVDAINLKGISVWADEIKPTTKNKPKDKESLDFLKAYPDTRDWHFVNLPLDATGYDRVTYKPFVREDDVVQMTVETINILMGNSTRFSKPNALRWLVHLIGDMHQPLHISCSYIDYEIPKLVFKGDEVISKKILQKSDRGGNKILLTKSKSLHSYWDDDLPTKDNDFKDVTYDPPPAVDKSKLTELPGKWVGENALLSKEAYKGLTVIGKNAKDPSYIDVQWDKDDYNKRGIPLIKSLSLKAANRLAFLLNSIYA